MWCGRFSVYFFGCLNHLDQYESSSLFSQVSSRLIVSFFPFDQCSCRSLRLVSLRQISDDPKRCFECPVLLLHLIVGRSLFTGRRIALDGFKHEESLHLIYSCARVHLPRIPHITINTVQLCNARVAFFFHPFSLVNAGVSFYVLLSVFLALSTRAHRRLPLESRLISIIWFQSVFFSLPKSVWGVVLLYLLWRLTPTFV